MTSVLPINNMASATIIPHVGTLQMIRKITDDGVLCEQEVWDLAEYLNENPDARVNWPGSELFPLLHQVFEDGILSQDEMAQMAGVLSDIEHQCARADIPKAIEKAPVSLDAIKVEDYSLPRIEKTAEIPCKPSGEVYSVNLRTHSCSCPAWFGNRKKFPVGSLNRACVHVVDAYKRELTTNPSAPLPKLLAHVVEDLSFRGRGVDVNADWKLLKVDTIPHLVSIGTQEWSTVYAPGKGAKFDRYAYHRDEDRWAYGAEPSRHRHVEEFLRAKKRRA
ncbi:MAG: hypothetical protein ISQ14_08840 [Verrucomicrobiae bacterium]|nr:hypothetical protein [Verrucomicrobiae bacterium]